jgi:hypothetical protein
MKPLVTS